MARLAHVCLNSCGVRPSSPTAFAAGFFAPSIRPSPGEGDTFPRSFVEDLRRENARYRERARNADTDAKRLHIDLVRATGMLADPTYLDFAEDHLDDPDAWPPPVDDLLARKPHLAPRRPTGEIGQGASPPAASSVDLAALLRQRADRRDTGDLTELADQAAEELLKAIRDQARTASDLKLLQLAQAYSMVVSTEVSTRLADEGATASYGGV